MKTTASGSPGSIVLLIVVTAWVMPAQPSSFEAASIHPLTPPFRALKNLKISGTLVTLEGYNVRWLVSEAFGVKDYQVSTDSVPRSALEVLYRIEARADGQSAPRKVAYASRKDHPRRIADARIDVDGIGVEGGRESLEEALH